MTGISVAIPGDVSGANPPATPEAVKPSTTLKDKFQGDVSKLASSYDAAETELGTLRAQLAELQKGKAEPAKEGDDLLKAGAAKPDDKSKKDEPPSADDQDKAAFEVAKAAGLDYEALEASFEKDGKLPDEAYVKLSKQGIPRSMVDAYLEGIKAQGEVQQARTAKAITDAGMTQDSFKAAAEWAAKGGLNDAELKAYNDAVNSGDEGRQKLALNFLAGKHAAVSNKEPALLTPDGGNGGNATGYESKAQWQADIADPRYAKDEAWRNRVKAKLAASGNLFAK